MLELLVCELCGLAHPITYDGLTCKNPKCKGKLIPITVVAMVPEEPKKSPSKIKTFT